VAKAAVDDATWQVRILDRGDAIRGAGAVDGENRVVEIVITATREHRHVEPGDPLSRRLGLLACPYPAAGISQDALVSDVLPIARRTRRHRPKRPRDHHRATASRISGAIRVHPQRRLQILEITRACLGYRNGAQELFLIIRKIEGLTSPPLRRLAKSITDVLS
jgi:hypothetical protein